MLISNGTIAALGLADAYPQYANANYYPTTSLGLLNEQVHYGEIYRRQLWVAVLTNKIARSVARLPLKVYQKGDTGRTDASQTPYGRLLRFPNPTHDANMFWRWTASTFEIYGEAMWWKDRGGTTGPPVNLWPLHPANMNVRRATQEDVDRGWVFRLNDLIYERFAGVYEVPIARYRADDIVHFRTYNPLNQVRGLSQLEPLRLTLLNEDAARRSTTSMWKRGARPAVVLKHPGKFSKPEVAHRISADFDAVAAGADNMGRTVTLEEGMDLQIIQLTAEEAQYIETRKLNREEACAVFDMPPPAVHILDHATFSNITEQMRSVYRDTMAPRLGEYESVLDAQLRPEFADDQTYAEFLMDEVLRGDFEQRAIAYQAADYLTMAEKRANENLPFIKGTDRIFVNAATVPLDEAGKNTKIAPESGVVPATEEQPAPFKKALDPQTIRTVMGRVSGKSLATLDLDRLVRGLNGDTAAVAESFTKSLDAGESPTEFHARLLAKESPCPT